MTCLEQLYMQGVILHSANHEVMLGEVPSPCLLRTFEVR